MNTNSMTVGDLIEKLESIDGAMNVKFVCASHQDSKIHGKIQFNTIDVSNKKQELQFIHNFDKPLDDCNNNYRLGALLSRIKRMLGNSSNVNKYSVCKRAISFVPSVEAREPAIYLKNIKTKSEIESHSFRSGGLDDTIFLEFLR